MLALHLGGGGGVTTEIMMQTFIYSRLYCLNIIKFRIICLRGIKQV